MVGKTLGDYEILAEIGRGGMGVVYRARQVSADREVALRTVLPRSAANPEVVERFRREAEVAARIRHPNLIEIYEFGEAEGVQYMAMELVTGESLADRLKRSGRLDPITVAGIASQAAGALAALHDDKMVHRDVKPSNVLIQEDGQVKVTDFGTTLLQGRDQHTRLTAAGAVMGTVEYMSPENGTGRRRG